MSETSAHSNPVLEGVGRDDVKLSVYASSRAWAVAQTLSMGPMVLKESLCTGTAPQRKNTCMFIPAVSQQTLEPLRGTRLWDYTVKHTHFLFLWNSESHREDRP